MIEYFLICIAFSLMYYIRYTSEVVFRVNGYCVIEGVENKLNVPAYLTASTIFSIIVMPVYMYMLVTSTKEEVITRQFLSIMKEFFDMDISEK